MKRTVFGRLRRIDYLGNKHTIEMREDGVYIRQFHQRKEWKVPFAWMFKFCHQQLELFNEQVDKGNQGATVPGVQKTIVVSDWGNAMPLHANPEPTQQDPQGRIDGLAALAGRADASTASPAGDAKADNQLPRADGGMDGGDNAQDVSGVVQPPGGPPMDAT